MKINFIDVGMIMSVVVALIILAVGVFAFFVTLQNIPITNTETEETIQEITDNGNSVFNIIGVVLVVGAMMSVISLVYNFVGRTNDGEPIRLKTHQKPAKIKSKSKTKKKNFEWGV